MIFKLTAILLVSFLSNSFAEEFDKTILIPKEQRQCLRDSDCIKVLQTTCSQCCQEAAIHKAHLKIYSQILKKQCEGFQGPVCDCQSTSRKTACENSLCVLKEEGV